CELIVIIAGKPSIGFLLQSSRDLADADAVVAGGRGVRGPEGFAAVECLADALGAAVGASRAAVDAGWRDHGCQIGKSGRVVSSKLYVALGVSGAVHHRMGMDSARTVVVVNSDPNAPFFKHADYGIVGDLFRIAPALAEEIRRMRDG
ncbi:MAG: electron transfer flavoprotein subunit alpha/FixB family protein, partial [Myxococcota bacterium]|nr:electron transfer flavoprotein subunit alpha/FixB family protein [Myxococcota bacterium]